ncbi:uncharacterized protein N7443_002199 [Penicillium atrosanguineum]|uniref:uncharacterized protein n=1 Tax=Penicillium atrosanguineum TaxID=1132637 RepID=UPI00238C496D|nr:uncharacterized protein N7443_002199 [Penicillium atrosanguineum]KAJ5309738.1 hypothetical protein N7443_002199 [Penicillium atrosanguineum]
MSGATLVASLPSRIASLVHSHFDALPTRSKPSIFPDGSREWIPMTGIVAVKEENTSLESLHCIAVTTGAKCLSASHIPRCRGLVLHDCHAEILALRAFNYWLLTECHGFIAEEMKCKNTPTSSFVRRRNQSNQDPASASSIDWPPFELQPDVKIYMYCTCAPCGDASMELCMATQEDATPWEVTRDANIGPNSESAEESMLDGRAHFSLLGIVRRKPARTDAESTRSKSCSDKIALRQVSSLLSCETTRLVAPTANSYLAGFILPEDEISRVGCDRSFGQNGRMAALVGRSWPDIQDCAENQVGFRFRPFDILSVPAEEVHAMWQFSKPKPTEVLPKKSKPGNASAVWTAAPSYSHSCVIIPDTGSKSLPALRRSKTGIYETLVNGVKQGNKASAPGPRGASSLSRAKLWALLDDIVSLRACHTSLETATDLKRHAESVPAEQYLETPRRTIQHLKTYEDLKRIGDRLEDPLRVREEATQDAKKVLKGWLPNAKDDSWGLDVLVDPKKRKR